MVFSSSEFEALSAVHIQDLGAQSSRELLAGLKFFNFLPWDLIRLLRFFLYFELCIIN